MTAMDVFGSQIRSDILVYVALAEESYPAEIAQALNVRKLTVQRIVADFERLGVLASRLRGRVRVVSLNRTWYAAVELRALLLRLGTVNERVATALAAERRRPRRTGKPM